jgi:diguanylate cyclase (GGDEF)-like protein/hemerythrin-like metal-binding protein/PAS domain S-box-containing protein
MTVNIPTLMLVQSVSAVVQVLGLAGQYKVAKVYRGHGWVILGNAFLALAFLLVSLGDSRYIGIMSIVGNSGLFVLGLLAIVDGIYRFLGEKYLPPWLVLVDAVLVLGSIFFSGPHVDSGLRRLGLSLALGLTSAVAARALLSKAHPAFRASARLLAAAFVAESLGFAARIGWTLATGICAVPLFDSSPVQVAFFFSMMILDLLITFGYIIMTNQRLEGESSEARANLELVFDTSPDAVLITTLEEGRLVAINEAFTSYTGFSGNEALGNSLLDLGVWVDAEERRGFVGELLAKGRLANREFTFRRKDGGSLVGLVSAKVFRLDEVPHILSVTHDISNRKAAETALRESETKFREMADLLPQIVFETDAEGRLAYVNRQAYPICGYAEDDDVIGVSALDLFVPEDRDRAIAAFARRVDGLAAGNNEYRIARKDGTIFPALVYATPVTRGGRVAGLRGIIVDISAQKRAEEEIGRLAHQLELERDYAQASASIDALTRVANRRQFDEVLRGDFFRLKRSNEPLSLIMLDIDHFKKYNDEYGHLAGDECLRSIGETLKRIVARAHDKVARYGGEEFAVIMPETGARGAFVIAERIRKAVEELSIAHVASPVSPWVTVSLGLVTVSPSGLAAPEKVIELADKALYEAKRRGRNRVERSSYSAGDNPSHGPGKPQLVRLVWSANDESGNPAIDAQHKELFDSANAILEALLGDDPKSECLPRVEVLVAHIADRFGVEEEILRAAQFPGLAVHCRIHAALLDKAKSIAERFESDDAVVGELFSFLVYEVIAQHMLLEDKKFFAYVGHS